MSNLLIGQFQKVPTDRTSTFAISPLLAILKPAVFPVLYIEGFLKCAR